MWHKHAIASRRVALALVAAAMLAPVYADAPYCSLRDPSHQIYDMYPEATGYRSVVGEVSHETQVTVGQQIPFPLLQGELGQHTLYVPVQSGNPLGYVQSRSELTEWGLAEIVWALNVEREIVDFRFQRCRGQACKTVLKKGLQEMLRGQDQAALMALLDDSGLLQASLAETMSDDERMLASVVTRSAVKVIAVIETSWSTTVAELAQEVSAP